MEVISKSSKGGKEEYVVEIFDIDDKSYDIEYRGQFKILKLLQSKKIFQLHIIRF